MWYYAAGGQQQGPVDDVALDDLVRQGVVRDDTLVWKAGMPNWQAHSSVRPRPAPAAAPAPPPAPAPMAATAQTAVPMSSPAPAAPSSAPVAAPVATQAPVADTRFCSECGRPYPMQQLYQMGAATVCASCYPAYMQRMSAQPSSMQAGAPYQPQMGGPQMMGGPQIGGPQMGQMPGAPMMMGTGMPMTGWHYGGFWIRFLARVIDAILVGIVSTIIRIPLALLMGGTSLLSLGRGDQDPAAALAALPGLFAMMGASFFIQIALGLVYEVYFLTSRGATVGKMALGLKVVRADGGPISMGLAAGRFFASYLSGFIFLIGYIMAGFDIEKRSLHDRICNTRVIYIK